MLNHVSKFENGDIGSKVNVIVAENMFWKKYM